MLWDNHVDEYVIVIACARVILANLVKPSIIRAILECHIS
jgi:hypothetical protein